MSRIAAVVLAAGAATRFGSPKQQLLLPRVLERLAQSPVDEIVVVEGAHGLSDTASRASVRLVRCAEWERGPGASLRCGLEALDADVDAALVVLADGPRLAPGAVTRVVESWRADGDLVVAASYAGLRGHPVLVARSAWTAIPDEGLRAVEPRLVACDDLGTPGDVDTPQDLAILDDPEAE
ncbi:MAG: nucleotidyltransferase family protein [Actinobacteria bacterium]|nr:nucleotidyltransferase family protein [Actinomycetota bacterium]